MFGKLFESADRFLEESDWKDIAMLKFCLFSMGLYAGSFAAEKNKPALRAASSIVFAVTYGPLMTKYFRIVREMLTEENADE